MFSKLCNRIIHARNYTHATNRRVRLVVIHTMEAPEARQTAVNVASWFAGSTAPQASAHYCVDAHQIIGCVDEDDVAWAAPGANSDGIQIELAGRAGQTAQQWRDAYSKAELILTAKLVADICRRHRIPVRHLNNNELDANKAGLIGHVQASQVYKRSDHTDPGPHFPWLQFVRDVKALNTARPRWYFVLTDRNGRVVARSRVTSRAGLAARFTAFSTACAPRVARMASRGEGPRIKSVRI